MNLNQGKHRNQAAWGGFALPMLLTLVILATACGDEVTDPTASVTTTSIDSETTRTETTATAPTTSTTLNDVTSPAPRFFTLATPTGTYSMSVDTSATVQLPPDIPEPTVEGESVILIGTANVVDSGNRQWELRAVEPGETTVTVKSSDGSIMWTLLVEPMP